MRTPLALPPSSKGKERGMVLHHPEVIVALDLKDHSEALELAKKLAAKHGRIVVVRDADGIEIATIFPPTKH
jgi:hypothetical protein